MRCKQNVTGIFRGRDLKFFGFFLLQSFVRTKDCEQKMGGVSGCAELFDPAGDFLPGDLEARGRSGRRGNAHHGLAVPGAHLPEQNHAARQAVSGCQCVIWILPLRASGSSASLVTTTS